jgi:2-keto-4-pentenoate hydratase/2-oxohepta-3-ene-1,7-dioic acid hydratase in catechol pathway
MKLAFFDDFKLGVVAGDKVVDVTDVVKDIPRLGPQDVMRAVIERFDALKDSLVGAAAKGHGKPVSQVRFRPPLLKPENIICMAVNYMEDGTLPEPAPMNAFMKSPSGPWRLHVDRSTRISCSRSLPTSKSTGRPRLKRCVSNTLRFI